MPAPRGMKPTVQNPGKVLARILKYVFKKYLIHCIVVLICIIISVAAGIQGTMFMKTLIDGFITPLIGSASPDYSMLLHEILRVAIFYGMGIVANFIQQKLMAYTTQGVMRSIRDDMFIHMETLPIKYFDTHSHGDIMSMYTNDVDTLRQMVSQSIPQLINSAITIVGVLASMIILSPLLTAISLVMIAIMLFVTRRFHR